MGEMKVTTIILGIVLFALVTMVLYVWGMVKQKNQSADLMNLLLANGEQRVRKYIKKNGNITAAEVENLCENMQAKLPFSPNKAVVQDKKEFAVRLLAYMVKTGELEQDGEKYRPGNHKTH